MDLTAFDVWLSAQPEVVKDVLVGAGGDMLGGLASQAVAALLGQAGGRVIRQFTPDPQSKALRRAMARAMVETLAEQIDDPDLLALMLGHFTKWLERPEVATELSAIIAPNPDVSLDLDLLETECEEAGFAAEWLGADVDFVAVVTSFVSRFYDAACLEDEFFPPITLQLLRGMADRMNALARDVAASKKVQEDIRDLLGEYRRLELSAIERNYLEGLYEECNILTIVKDERDDPGRRHGPRLQRVYVEVRTTRSPGESVFLKRLGVAPAQGKRILTLLQRALRSERGDQSSRLSPDSSREQVAELIEAVQRADEQQLARVTASTNITEARLRAATATLTPMEALREEGQIVIIGEPGSGKSMLTQRLAALLAVAGTRIAIRSTT